MIPIAVLASGRGSGFEAVAQAIQEGRLAAKIVTMICDQPGAPVLEKAKRRGIRARLIEAATKIRDPEQDMQVIDEAKRQGAEFLVMAGYMRIVGRQFLESYRSDRGYTRVVNIHPSLLPKYKGLHAYRQAFEAGEKEAGVTVHLVEEQVDLGPICAQEKFTIAECKNWEEVEKRGLAIEHRLYPETLSWILPGEI